MKKISSVDALGKILFEDAKGTGTTAGTKEDCLAYGYDFDGTNCYVSKSQIPKNDSKVNNNGNLVSGVNNNIIGKGNIVNGSHARVLGNGNIVERRAKQSVTIGMGCFTDKFGEIAFGSSINSNRGKYSILQYNGRTTDASTIELYLGGKYNECFYVDPNYESAFWGEIQVVAFNKTDGEAKIMHKYFLFKYVGTTFTEVINVIFINSGDTGMSSVNMTINVATASSKPDKITIRVTGLAGKTIDYNGVLKVNEVRDYES
ncbi:MAG: hypothetical protein Unbinned92contig1003_10 [Prokaryotic dsDNA virus sp.]|nr:MAG: hypothetical protein Unbinned92contig1003_10 [Prokaryotic dsDNA virus sp.]|tara:strand:+ start:11401 stop:12180 length:780 start_codon:yes stop_codon:yes gene_type:complete